MCTGEFAKHRGTDTFRVLFFDLNHACLSQMAEAIGNSMRPPRFEFSSAGVATQSLDARAVEFMAGKGIDISRQASKPLEQGAALGAVPGGGRAGGTGAQGVSYPARQDRHLYLVGQGPGERRGAGRRCTSRIRIGLREP